MNFLNKQKLQLLLLTLYLSISCEPNDPTLIQLPDRTSPSGYIVSPLDGSSVKGNTTLQVIAIDNEKVDTVYFMIKAENADNYESIDFSTIEANDTWEGDWDTRNAQWQENENYFITFKAVDIVGNTFIAPPVIVKVDNQDDEAPTGYIKNPITGQIVNGTVTIEVEASDNTTIQYVSILVNNEIKVTHLSEPYSYQWNTENEVDDLVYSIYAVIVDIDNNRTTIPPISVTVNNQLPTDVTPPTGALTSPPAGSTVYGTTLIQVTAADDQLVDYMEVYIDGDLDGSIDCNGPSCTGSYEWNTLPETDGEHTIQVLLFDGWNNSTVLTSVNVWVDNIDQDEIHPSVVIIDPAAGQTINGSVDINALALDNIGVQRVEFYIDAILTHIDSIGPEYNYTWNTDTFPDDEDYIISLIAFDLVGNDGPSTPITVHLDNYDNVTPNGYIAYPYAGQNVSGLETINIFAEDNNEVSVVEFYIDNNLVYSDYEEPYDFEWNTELEFEDLNHIIGAIVKDQSDNIFEVPSISVFVNNIPNDTNPPTIIITSPSSGQTVSGTINFTVLANDDTGISHVELYINGQSLGVIESEPYTYVWDTNMDIGGHDNDKVLSALAEDTSGNITFAQPIVVEVSN